MRRLHRRPWLHLTAFRKGVELAWVMKKGVESDLSKIDRCVIGDQIKGVVYSNEEGRGGEVIWKGDNKDLYKYCDLDPKSIS